MRPSVAVKFLEKALKNNMPIMLTGAPGVGKTDIVSQAAHNVKYEVMFMHPVVSSPTDYKGIPFRGADMDVADFLPDRNLKRLMDAEDPLVVCLDDLGQAPMAVQAAAMQMILARSINGKPIGPGVRWVACTNRKQDKAGVTGILEPVKSRFTSIIELTNSVDDWTPWALEHGMPPVLIAAVSFKPELLMNFQPTTDMTNSVCPRTVAHAGRWMCIGLTQDEELEVFEGACGKEWATDMMAFLRTYRDLPDPKAVLRNPEKADVPEDKPNILYALVCAIAEHTVQNKKRYVDNFFLYLSRIKRKELAMFGVNLIVRLDTSVAQWGAYKDWVVKHRDLY